MINPDLFIYDKMPRKANFGTDIEATTSIYIHPSLLKHHEWITYNKGYLLRYSGVRDFLLEMAFITNLAYTYKVSGKELLQISPFYIQSLYSAMDWKSALKDFDHQYRRTSHVLRTSRMMKDFITMEERGHIACHPETGKRTFFYTKYRVTDRLKELASTMDWNDTLLEVEIGDIVKKGFAYEKLPCMKKERLYVVTLEDGSEKEFSLLVEARRWCEQHDSQYVPELVQTPNRLVRINTVKKHILADLHRGKTISKKIDVEGKPVSLSNTVSINRKEIESLLMNPETGSKYPYHIMAELFRMYDETTDEDTSIELKYFQSKQGRHYTQGSAIQLFPKELRERVLSDYVAVDMECSIFSLYKNLATKYGYKKKTPQIDAVINDRRAYRERFVSSQLPYEGVKTVLTAIAYGAIVDVYNMYMEVNNSMRCFRKSSLLSCGYDKMSVVNMCNTSEIEDLTKELRSMGRFIISKCTSEDKSYIINLCGNRLSLKTKKTFGVKMAHVYQSYEAAILTELRNVTIEGFPLGCMNGAIGWYLHDGLYVRKALAKKYDLCKMFSDRIKEVFDFNISYEIE